MARGMPLGQLESSSARRAGRPRRHQPEPQAAPAVSRKLLQNPVNGPLWSNYLALLTDPWVWSGAVEGARRIPHRFWAV